MTFELEPERPTYLLPLDGSKLDKWSRLCHITLAKNNNNNNDAEISCHRCDRPFANIENAPSDTGRKLTIFSDTACSCKVETNSYYNMFS